MAGWNLKSGDYCGQGIKDDELWPLFNYVFSDACRKTNTYKFGLIKAICDQIYDLKISNGMYFLSYDKLFYRFTENYWNLVNVYKLKQMTYNGKSEYSRIELILKDAVRNNNILSNIPFLSLPDEIKTSLVKEVMANCKRNVVGALYNDFDGKLYSFFCRGEGIYLGEESYNFISKYKFEIERLNYYSWAKFLEKKNNDVKSILGKLDKAVPEREDLSKFRTVLLNEFHQDKCFYCGNKLKRKIHVDHFIPWSFVKSDNLWNFVLACPQCNSKKKDYLPDGEYVRILEKRNADVDKEKMSQLVKDEFSNYYHGLLFHMWKYAQLSGFKMSRVLVAK